MSRLVDRYDLVILDLDGVVYLDREPIPAAAEAIERLRDEGRAVAFATNNASRRPDEVAELLTSLDIPAKADEVVTSAQVAARLLADRLPAGSAVLVVGAPALRHEVAEAGLSPVSDASGYPAAVVQGYATDVTWTHLAEACVAVRAGARWVATNTDRTLPSPRGPLPGNGALVSVLSTALDRQPDEVAGKPYPGLFRRAAQRAGAARCLVVGDRLDTDIAGARQAGMDSMLVLTGVAGPGDLIAAPPEGRPDHVGADLAALFAPPAPLDARMGGGSTEVGGGSTEVGGWTVRRTNDGLELDGAGESMDALRAICALAWSGRPAGRVSAGSAAAAAALGELRLGG